MGENTTEFEKLLNRLSTEKGSVLACPSEKGQVFCIPSEDAVFKVSYTFGTANLSPGSWRPCTKAGVVVVEGSVSINYYYQGERIPESYGRALLVACEERVKLDSTISYRRIFGGLPE